MIFWAPDDGSRTGNSLHPRSEFRELLNPGNGNLNWTLDGTHVLTATCVVSNVPSDTMNVCIGQIHEPNTKPDGSVSANNEQMILFNLASKKIFAHIEIDGNTNTSFDQTLISGAGSVVLGRPINYTMSAVDGLLTIIVNNVTNSWNLYGGTNFQGKIFTNWGAATGNTFYFKAGNYNQTGDACGCSTDGSLVAFYSLTLHHAASITNQPASLVVGVRSNATFTVGADGNGTLSYQWWFNATNKLTGATSPSLTVANAVGANAGNYTVVVSDNTSSFSSATSAVATLTVIDPHTTTTVTFTNAGLTNWICPADVSSVQVESWGGGGAGGSAVRTPNMNSIQYGGGGAGGAYARLDSYAVIAGNTYYINVGAGGMAATGTLTNDVKMPGGDSWFNSVNSEPVGAGSCVAKGGDGGECAVGNTATTAFGAGGTGTTGGSIGDVLFAGGSGGTQTSSANGYGGGGGGSGGTGSAGNTGTINGTGATAVPGGGSGGNPNVSLGNSGPGQTPTISPGGGGGGARASVQQPGGNGAAGQVVLTYNYDSPSIINLNMSADHGTLTLTGTGAASQPYVLLSASSLTPPVIWIPVVTNIANSVGAITFTDSQVANFTQRFYRIATP